MKDPSPMFMVTKQVGKSSSFIKYSLVMCIFYMQIVSKLLHYFPTIIVLMNGKGIYIIIHTILFHVIEFTYSEYFILSIEYICELHNPIQEINHANKNDIHIAINRNKMKLSIYISIYQLFTVEYIIRKRKTISRMWIIYDEWLW
jgi:hypothetical protein